MLLNNIFEIGDLVYLKSDKEQNQRIVTAIQLNGNGLLYRVVCGTVETWHYGFEISFEKSLIEMQSRIEVAENLKPSIQL